jgi:uncharacterized RDD family membrane protein YckC
MDIRSVQAIQTPEGIPLHVELAGVANRVFAFGVDLLLLALLLALVTALLFMARTAGASPELLRTVTPPLLLVIPPGYYLLQEWLWNGKTVGKALFRLRVVRTNGQPIGFWEAFGRNLLRVVDVSLSGIGLPCMMLNRGEKRFGDFLAGTMVILEQPIVPPGSRLADNPNTSSRPAARLTSEETDLLRAYLDRRSHLLKDSRRRLEQALCRYFSGRLGVSIQSDRDLSDALEA